jgi:hypothetical protein
VEYFDRNLAFSIEIRFYGGTPTIIKGHSFSQKQPKLATTFGGKAFGECVVGFRRSDIA